MATRIPESRVPEVRGYLDESRVPEVRGYLDESRVPEVRSYLICRRVPEVRGYLEESRVPEVRGYYFIVSIGVVFIFSSFSILLFSLVAHALAWDIAQSVRALQSRFLLLTTASTVVVWGLH